MGKCDPVRAPVLIEKLPLLLAHSKAVFIINDIIAGESLDKQRQSLLELAISGRLHNHYLWLLIQTYSHSVYWGISPFFKKPPPLISQAPS